MAHKGWKQTITKILLSILIIKGYFGQLTFDYKL